MKDVVRSVIRQGAQGVEQKWGTLRQGFSISGWLRRMRRHEVRIADDELTRRMAKLVPASALTIAVSESGVHAHASLQDGEVLDVLLTSMMARFATGGAKELELMVYPSQLSTHPVTRSLATAFAAVVAHSLWRVVLGPAESVELITVDDDDGRLRVDLRSLPAVRAALHRQWARTIIDMVNLKRIQPEPGRLRLILAPLLHDV